MGSSTSSSFPFTRVIANIHVRIRTEHTTEKYLTVRESVDINNLLGLVEDIGHVDLWRIDKVESQNSIE